MRAFIVKDPDQNRPLWNITGITVWSIWSPRLGPIHNEFLRLTNQLVWVGLSLLYTLMTCLFFWWPLYLFMGMYIYFYIVKILFICSFKKSSSWSISYASWSANIGLTYLHLVTSIKITSNYIYPFLLRMLLSRYNKNMIPKN
jgi:hypothetical protein